MSQSLRFTVSVERGKTEIIELKNVRGSIQHYFHFMLGGLLPLINFVIENGEGKAVCIKTNVGPMQRILEELDIKLVERDGPATQSLRGFDCYLDQDLQSGGINKMTPEIRARILEWFERTLPNDLTDRKFASKILIERAKDPFFDTEKAMVKTSGSDRRSISNHDDLVEGLKIRFGSHFENIVLEKESIYSQFCLFSQADLVIAQHGAALANIFFMKPGSHVVEIAPPWGRTLNMFENLAGQCGVRYTQIEQEENHSPVDVAQLLACL